MEYKQIETFKEIWMKYVVGTEFNDGSGDLKTYLYKSLISKNAEILNLLNLRIPNTRGVNYLRDLVNIFSKVESNPLGFFPIGILKTKKLTCAGNTMITNTLLKENGFKVKYARPANHSVNIVNYDTKDYWVDCTNGVLEIIDIEIDEKETFSIAHIYTDNECIHYKIAPLFEPQDIIINIFGNMEALKSRKDDDKQVQEYLKENKRIYEVNFNHIKEVLYKEYFDYVRYDSDFQKEQERIKKWIEKS